MTTTKPQPEEQDLDVEDRPPIFRTWSQLYVLVLALHALFIFILYLFTKAHS